MDLPDAVRGEVYTRVFGSGVKLNTNPTSSRWSFESKTLPRNAKGCEISKRGYPIIKSEDHAKRVAAANNMVHVPLP